MLTQAEIEFMKFFVKFLTKLLSAIYLDSNGILHYKYSLTYKCLCIFTILYQSFYTIWTWLELPDSSKEPISFVLTIFSGFSSCACSLCVFASYYFLEEIVLLFNNVLAFDGYLSKLISNSL